MTVILSSQFKQTPLLTKAQLQDHFSYLLYEGKILIFSLKKNCYTITHIHAPPINVIAKKMLYIYKTGAIIHSF